MSALELPTLSEKDKEAIEWMNETIENVPRNNFWYRVVCFLIGKRKKKMTYKEMYIFYTNTYKDDDLCKEKAMDILLEIYFFNNNRYPFKEE